MLRHVFGLVLLGSLTPVTSAASGDWPDLDPALAVTEAALSADGKQALVAYTGVFPTRRSSRTSLKLWDVEKERIEWSFYENHTDIVFLCFPPGDRVLCAYKDGTIKLLERAKGAVVRTFTAFEASLLNSAFGPIALSSDRRWLLAQGSDDGETPKYKVIDIVKGNVIREFVAKKYATAVSMSPDKKLGLFSSYEGDYSSLLDLQTGETVSSFDRREGWKFPARFAGDGRIWLWRMVSNTPEDGKRLVRWDPRNRQIVREYQVGDAGIYQVLADGARFLTSYYDPDKGVELRSWDVESGKNLRSWRKDKLHENEQVFFTGSDQAKHALSASGDPRRAKIKLHLWDMEDRQRVRSWADPTTLDEHVPPTVPRLAEGFVEETPFRVRDFLLERRWLLIALVPLLALLILLWRRRKSGAKCE